MASFAEWTEKEKKKRKKQLAEGVSFTEYTKGVLGKNDIEAPLSERESDIAPVKTQGEEKERKWFDKSVFDDGYQFGDVTKAILGTGTDLGKNLTQGVVGMGEKAWDGLLTLGATMNKSQMNKAAENELIFNAVSGRETKGVLEHYQDVQKEVEKATAAYVAKDLYDEEDVARKIIEGSWQYKTLKKMGAEDEDSFSVLGEKSDALTQSAGQLGATMALQAAGVPWWLTTGATTFGDEAEHAFKEGADFDEAVFSATVTAGAEILTEKISGGIKFGGKALDDVLTKELARGISNKTVRTLLKLGIDAVGEGNEEIISGVMSALGQKLTYADDKEMSELFSSEEAFESFIGGAVLGGTSSVANAGKAKINGVDSVTGLTETEQKVVDGVYKSRVEQAEQRGKVSEKEKKKIHDIVMSEFEKGYIGTDEIEAVLGGDSYTAYRDMLDSNIALKQERADAEKEYKTLNGMKLGEMTGEQQDRRTSLKQRLEELTAQIDDENTTEQRKQAKLKLFGEVYDIAKESPRLAESYNELARSQQKFEVDLNKYSGKQRELLQAVMEKGQLDNSRRTHETWDWITRVGADKGINMTSITTEEILEMETKLHGEEYVQKHFTGVIPNAVKLADGTIAFNVRSNESRRFLVGHEITHTMEKSKYYKELRKLVYAYAENKMGAEEFAKRKAEIAELYDGIENTDADSELTCDLIGEYVFNDPDFVYHLSATDQNIFQKIWSEIKYLYKMATAGSQEARDLERINHLFEKAYREQGKSSTGKKFSLGYHAGDLGKAELLHQQGYGRGTGHFGTGTYFVGNEAEISDGDYGKRPHHAVEFDNYNLYKAKDYKDGYSLHEQLKVIDGGISQEYYDRAIADEYSLYPYVSAYDLAEAKYKTADNSWDDAFVPAYQEIAKQRGIEYKTAEEWSKENDFPIDDEWFSADYAEYLKEVVNEETEKAQKDYAEFRDAYFKLWLRFGTKNTQKALQDVIRYQSQINPDGERNYFREQAAKANSFATVFMKSLGYEGIDVRGIEGLDNTKYGSVIYDLKGEDLARKEAIGTAKYSLSKDTEGKELSKAQQDFFKDSKMRDENGNLKVMYHGTNESFTVFDKSKAKSSGTYGNGFYFSDSISHANTYGENLSVYLNITNPLQNGTRDISKEQLRKFVKAVADNEDYGIDNYGYGATVDSVTDDVYGKDDFAMLLDINISCVGNMVEAIELFNEVNGTDYDGIVAPTETVAFYPNQIKSTANTEPTSNADIRYSLSRDIDGKPIDTARISTEEADTRYSLSHSKEIADGQKAYINDHKAFITADELEEAQRVTAAMVDVMMKYSSILPEDKIGKVITKNGSYDRSVENTTICVRTLAYNEFVDKVQEEIGRPLTQMESFLVSQKMYDIATDPQCLYCYVSLDRKAFNDMLLRYMQDRDTVIARYNNSDKTKATIEQLYDEFLHGRKPTKEMRKRFDSWIACVDNGTQLLSLADIATEERQSAVKAGGGTLAEQLADARKYAQSASWSKIQKDYVAYRDEILKLGDRVVKNLNDHYGMRWYSFSDYSAAFIVENMQQITDASIRGLKGLSYTKDTDYAEIFAPSGMNINISVFVNTDADGNFFIDEKQSANLEKAMELRERYPNVGIVATVTNDEALRWVAEQEWSDMIIPFHIVRTGLDVAEYYKWLNYTGETSDTIADKDLWNAYLDSLNLKSENARKKVNKDVYPNEHKNDKNTYLSLCESRGLTPRFVRFAGEPWYMKLVNETRLSSDDSAFLKPNFDLGAAERSFSKFVDKGGYEGGWYKEGTDVDAEAKIVAADVLAGKKANEVEYGRQDGFVPEELIAGRKTNRQHLQHSLSPIGENTRFGNAFGDKPIRYGDYIVQGKDVMLEQETAPMQETAPVQETETVEDMFPDNLAPIAEEMATETQAENFASITDADAPPVTDKTYDSLTDTISIDSKPLKQLTKTIGDALELNRPARKELAEVLQQFSQDEYATRESLFAEIERRFGEYEDVFTDDYVAEAKDLVKRTKINVSPIEKAEFGGAKDYTQFMRSNFGKIRFSKDGMSTDQVYEMLSETYPNLFPADIINPADRLVRIAEVANTPSTELIPTKLPVEMLQDATDMIYDSFAEYRETERMAGAENMQAELNAHRAEFDAPIIEKSETPAADATPVKEAPKEVVPVINKGNKIIKTVDERIAEKLKGLETELHNNEALRAKSFEEYTEEIEKLRAEYRAKKSKNSIAANDILRRIERLQRLQNSVDTDYAKRISDLSNRIKSVREEQREGHSATEERLMRKELHEGIIEDARARFADKGFDMDKVFRNAKNLSAFSTVDNTPQRVMEKTLGYKAGQVLSDITVNKVAQNETEGIRWLNRFTDRKNGVLSKLAKKYNIKVGSKEDAAAQMFAEGFYVNEKDEIVKYGYEELVKDFPDAKTRENIMALAKDPIVREIYDSTLAAINESRTRNGYKAIPRLDNYFLHFRAMNDTFSRLGIPFNPNDIRAKDLPTDLNGVTADLKPGQPFFASAMHRTGQRTSFSLLRGMEQYLTGAKNQIYHIDDIQTLRALRNYIADTYGQAHGLESLDLLSEEEAQDRIEKVYKSHLSNFAKFLNEEANVIAGKTTLIDRGLEGIIGRRGLTTLNTINQQVGSNMVGMNVSSSLTNLLPIVQTFAKSNKFAFVKGFSQLVSNRVGSIFGRNDGFTEESPVFIRRKGAERLYRTPWQKAGDFGYTLMGAVDSVATELIARTKYNEYTRNGMDSQQAHYETDKWVSKLMGDRSLGQMPQLYNSKMLGLFTKFQLEVRNQLDSQFYDTVQETKASTEDIENGLKRNAVRAAKITATFVELAVVQHLFGKAFESIAGYNPAFDIIEVLTKMFGWDDDEEDEDTVTDNLTEGFLALLEDLPYTSTLTGGRIPISSALPITEFINGKDQYGNEKSRLETIGEAALYYPLPTGYGQIKKAANGLKMFDDDLPIAGSYTDSGNLRFPVEETVGNKVQAALFGQWASKNARDYFDNEWAPLKEKQIQEFIDLDIPIKDYREIRKGLQGKDTLGEKAAYIVGLDLPIYKKNLLINNIADRSEEIDLTDMELYDDWGEFDYAKKYPEKHAFLEANGVSYDEYENFDEDTKNAWSWAYQNPEKYTLSKAVSDDLMTYRAYRNDINDIEADKDANGDSISGSKKEKVTNYINGLDIDYGQKIILYRSMYSSKEDKRNYNADIVDYLNSRDDISYEEMVSILEELDMTVHEDGTVTW